MRKPIVKLYTYPVRFQILEKLQACGVDLQPGERTKVSFVIKKGTRRKIKSGTLYFQPKCGDRCCSECLVATFGKTTQYIY